jgi:hypothetical protein
LRIFSFSDGTNAIASSIHWLIVFFICILFS